MTVSPAAARTLRQLFALWFPLALSFELMMFEGPALQAAVSRLADPQTHLAAWGLTMSLSLLVESPVIMLLSTSIALTRDHASYLTLKRFVVDLCLACTALAATLAFTPLYDAVTGGLLGQPLAVREAARPALQIMLLWTAAIGWRRFYQGLLVRAGKTRFVSWGTLARLLAVLGSALWILAHSVAAGKGFTGVVCAATAIMAGVLVEALVCTWFARPAVQVLRAEATQSPSLLEACSERALLEGGNSSQPTNAAPPATGADPLTYRRILAYHAPLAATTLLNLLAMPVNAAALARLSHREATLAAWPVLFGLLLVLRGWGMALQEISVAHASDPHERQPLIRFTWLVGGVTTALTWVLVFTPLLSFYLEQVMRVPPSLHPYIRLGLALCSLQPLITSLASLQRGTLMAWQQTQSVYRGNALSLMSLLGLLGAAVVLQVPGIVGASIAFMGSTLVELAYLTTLVRRSTEGHPSSQARAA